MQHCPSPAAARAGGRPRKIDVHTHIIPREWPNWNERFGYTGWLQIQHTPDNPVSPIYCGRL